MTRRTWVRLDNASNIFLAARTERDPKVFRLSAEMDHHVEPQRLQQALDITHDRYRLYHAVLRRAIFWYYLQDSDLRPVVTPDDQPTCAPIYDADRTGLLFRVRYHRNRVVLEVFHALSDGTGALWFLTDLVTEYIRLRHPDQRLPEDTSTAQLTAQPGGVDEIAAARALVSDSFTHYFRGRRAAAPPVKQPDNTSPKLATAQRVYRVKGTPTPDYRTRAVELTMPSGQVLNLARAEEVSVTMYLTALFFDSLHHTSPGLGKTPTMAASVPVNLRQFFPSVSPRNFFTTIRVEHTYGQGDDDVGTVARQLDGQFRPQVTAEALDKKLRRLSRAESSPLLRILPRPVKDGVLRAINRVNNRGLTVAVSNLGRVSLPQPIDEHVGRMTFHVSAVRPQICVISHAGQLTVTFSSPFVETDHIRQFARYLTSRGVELTVAAAKATEAELHPTDEP